MKYTLLAFAVQQAIVPFFIRPFKSGNNSFRSNNLSLIAPAVYAFAIWGPIYLFALAFAVYLAFFAPAQTAVVQQIIALALVLYAGSSAWLYAANKSWTQLTVPILIVMAISASAALILTLQVQNASLEWQIFGVSAFGLYAGWTISATFVNISAVLQRNATLPFALSRLQLDAILLAAISVCALAMIWVTSATPSLVATFAWALVAILIASRKNRHPRLIFWATLTALVAVSLCAGYIYLFRA